MITATAFAVSDDNTYCAENNENVELVSPFNTTYYNSESGRNEPLTDITFFQNADRSVNNNADGTITFSFDLTHKIDNVSPSETRMEKDSLDILAFDYKTATAIDDWIKSYSGNEGIQQLPAKKFLDNTLVLNNKIIYTAKTSNGVTYYRVEEAEVKASVYNGTTIVSRNLNYGGTGLKYGGGVFSQSHSINITSMGNPYTLTLMHSFPYISPDALGSGVLGETFRVVVRRGTTVYPEYSFTNNIIG
jgi:hypothetical protein